MIRKMMNAALALLAIVALALPCAALADYSMPVADGDLSVYPGLDENVKNILLIGTDTREKDLASGRADTMMICSINQKTGIVHITSLARDTWVTIGDNGHKNKLNAAHSFGGPNLLMQTINRTYHLNIEHYVTVNFYGICDIVDILGGVTIQLEENEPWAINSSVEESYADYGDTRITPVPADATEAKLCGAQALAYARIRKLDNDFGRQNRQRKLLMAMASEVANCSIPQMISLATTCFDHVATNMSLMDIISLGTKVLASGVSDIQMHAFPEEGEYRYDSANGVSKLFIDEAYAIEKLHGYMYPDKDFTEN
ncbi:MAG: LytR family transcriptional regulator [Clostridiales bacterium]|nr:LytR family transcriptional regulator [Clostridiales bacterium]